jgi:predicted GNAT family N-acyltransferase
MTKKIDVHKSEKKGTITIHKMVVPKEERGKGVGSEYLRKLTSEADKSGKNIALTPSSDFGGNLSKLKKFYKSHGFEENKGKKRDYEVSESYIRRPKSK